MSKPKQKPGKALAVVDKPGKALAVVDKQIEHRKAQREAREKLTPAEVEQLETLESVIADNLRSGIKAVVAIGDALLIINQNMLYRVGHQKFEVYCLKVWDFTRQHAYRLMAYAKVQHVLTPIGYRLPNEAAAREFAPIADKPALIKKVAQALGEDPTASAVRTEVAKHAKIKGGPRTKAAKKRTKAVKLPPLATGPDLLAEIHEYVRNTFALLDALAERGYDTAPLHQYVVTMLEPGHKVTEQAWLAAAGAMQKQFDKKEKEESEELKEESEEWEKEEAEE